MWIGILSTSGEFQYSDGTQLTFSNWDEGQPRHWKWQEHCVTVIKNNRWSAEDCSKKFSFICEYEGKVENPTSVLHCKTRKIITLDFHEPVLCNRRRQMDV